MLVSISSALARDYRAEQFRESSVHKLPQPCVTRISITSAAFEAIAATLPHGSAASRNISSPLTAE
jgi:hypothetical protein